MLMFQIFWTVQTIPPSTSGKLEVLSPPLSPLSCVANCSGHGDCDAGVAPPKCRCYEGYFGLTCGAAVRTDAGDCPLRCSERGVCLAGVCHCDAGFYGTACGADRCPRSCSAHGRCLRTGCECAAGWTGEACAARECPNDCAGHGACDERAGTCTCDRGYGGSDCSFGGCPSDCTGHGECNPSQRCSCDRGWTGAACAIKTCNSRGCVHGECIAERCHCFPGHYSLGVPPGDPRGVGSCDGTRCPMNCHEANGRCGVDGRCTCAAGFTGLDCGDIECPRGVSVRVRAADVHANRELAPPAPRECSGRGTCVSGVCECAFGWEGEACATKRCPGQCNQRGFCVAGQCVCQPNWTGVDCSRRQCADCSSHGHCAPYAHLDAGARGNLPPTLAVALVPSGLACSCEAGWTGERCEVPLCTPPCSAHGTCQQYERAAAPVKIANDAFAPPSSTALRAARCECALGWKGRDCRTIDCIGNCSDRGACRDGVCYCPAGWGGTRCELRLCPSGCSDRGVCTAQGLCICADGWTGRSCTQRLCPNVLVPPSAASAGGGGGGATRALYLPCSGHGKCVTPPRPLDSVFLIEDAVDVGGGERGGVAARRKRGETAEGVVNHRLATLLASADLDELARISAAAAKAVEEGGGDAAAAAQVPLTAIAMQHSKAKVWQESDDERALRRVCKCDEPWRGVACAFAVCPSGCSAHGSCDTANGVCTCESASWRGAACDVPVCVAPLGKGRVGGESDGGGDCNGHGVCRTIFTTIGIGETPACVCDKGWADATCSRRLCLHGCSGHGTCNYGTCQCDFGWSGSACNARLCFPIRGARRSRTASSGTTTARMKKSKKVKSSVSSQHAAAISSNPTTTTTPRVISEGCGPHGECDGGSGECFCDPKWGGRRCDIPVCLNQCRGHGQCISTSAHISAQPTCLCDKGWYGVDCAHRGCVGVNAQAQLAAETALMSVEEGGGDRASASGSSSSSIISFSTHLRRLRVPSTKFRAQSALAIVAATSLTCGGHGACVNSMCECKAGWLGDECEVQACDSRCPAPPVAVCVEGKCLCGEGWSGLHCRRRTCPHSCSAHGRCMQDGCVCDKGWRGKRCSVSTCSGRGRWMMRHPGVAVSAAAAAATAATRTPTPPRSAAAAPTTLSLRGGKKESAATPSEGGGARCVCDAPFAGKFCERSECPLGCSGVNQGSCVSGKCYCFRGFTGLACAAVTCPNPCSGHGVCLSSERREACLCATGWSGAACDRVEPVEASTMTVDGSSMNETRTKAAGPARSHPQLRALSHTSHERQQRERELERRAMLRKLRSAAATVTLEEEEHARDARSLHEAEAEAEASGAALLAQEMDEAEVAGSRSERVERHAARLASAFAS